MHAEPVVSVMIAVVTLLLVGAAAAIGLKRLNLPYTVGLVLVGLALGALAERTDALAPLEVVTLSPELVLFVFLPTLIFESAYNLDSRLLFKNLAPVFTLAIPGLLLSTALVGIALAAATPLSFKSALLFGALISATDPVAVIALFKEVGAPRRLQILVEGESLFNDATAIVLFRLVLAAAGAVTLATIGSGVLSFVIVFGGGLGVGALIGWVMMRSISIAEGDPLVQVALSTVVAYAAFIVADHYLDVSGVMAVLSAGLVVGIIGSTRFTPEVRAYLHRFWGYAAFVANSLIFLLVGMAVTPGTVVDSLGMVVVAVVVVLAARAVTVFGLLPVVGRLPGAEPIGWKYRNVLAWGGLRGAVALALVLSLPADFAQRDLMVTLVFGVVLFTLVSGGLTIKPLVHALGLDRPGIVERMGMAQAALEAKREGLARLSSLEAREHCSASLLEEVARPYRADLRARERALATLRAECTTEELTHVLWSEALSTEQRAYRDLFENGAISESVLHELDLAVELARDRLKRGRLPRMLPDASPIEVRIGDVLVRFVERFAPRSRLVQRHRLRAVASRYEHDAAVFEVSGLVAAEVDRLSRLSEIDPHLVARCREAYAKRGERAMARIDAAATHFPHYAHAVQRLRARQMGLAGEADAIGRLEAKGVLPLSVSRSMRQSLEEEQRMLHRQPVAELAPQPDELLAHVPFFADLTTDDAARVVELLVPRTFLAGEPIVQQGDRGTSMFLIARGVVSVLLARPDRPLKRIATLYPGDFFGEMALLTEARRRATVQCVTDCQAYELAKRDVDRLCEMCTGVREALTRATEERARALARPSDQHPRADA